MEFFGTYRNLKLGENYLVYYNYTKKLNCKLIKVTRKGYNLLNIDTNKCILRQHLYPSRKRMSENEIDQWWFLMSARLIFEK